MKLNGSRNVSKDRDRDLSREIRIDLNPGKPEMNAVEVVQPRLLKSNSTPDHFMLGPESAVVESKTEHQNRLLSSSKGKEQGMGSSHPIKLILKKSKSFKLSIPSPKLIHRNHKPPANTNFTTENLEDPFNPKFLDTKKVNMNNSRIQTSIKNFKNIDKKVRRQTIKKDLETMNSFFSSVGDDPNYSPSECGAVVENCQSKSMLSACGGSQVDTGYGTLNSQSNNVSNVKFRDRTTKNQNKQRSSRQERNWKSASWHVRNKICFQDNEDDYDNYDNQSCLLGSIYDVNDREEVDSASETFNADECNNSFNQRQSSIPNNRSSMNNFKSRINHASVSSRKSNRNSFYQTETACNNDQPTSTSIYGPDYTLTDNYADSALTNLTAMTIQQSQGYPSIRSRRSTRRKSMSRNLNRKSMEIDKDFIDKTIEEGRAEMRSPIGGSRSKKVSQETENEKAEKSEKCTDFTKKVTMQEETKETDPISTKGFQRFALNSIKSYKSSAGRSKSQDYDTKIGEEKCVTRKFCLKPSSIKYWGSLVLFGLAKSFLAGDIFLSIQYHCIPTLVYRIVDSYDLVKILTTS